MLKTLRVRLTLLCAGISGLVLLLIAAAALGISENQMRQASYSMFQASINSITTKLQSDSSVSYLWLSQTEAANSLLIHIEDRGVPLKFRGSWTPLTDRNSLITRVQETALSEYGLDLKLPPMSVLQSNTVVFEIRGAQNERYLAAAVQIPGIKGWQSLALLQDMRRQDGSVWEQRFLFGGIVLVGVGLLSFWSYFFVGRMLRPVEQSRKKQVQFVAAASHELRSPLAVIQASTAVLQAGSGTDDSGRFLQNIERECGRMGRLIEDLLLLAGSDANTWTMNLRDVDVDALLVETAELFYPLAAKKGHTLCLELPEDPLPDVEGDVQRLQQILTVLLDNAFCYTPEGGKITLRGSANGRSVFLEVADTGPGIPEEHAAHIFDRFYRADKSRNDKSHFGLGLSIAQELARQQHGKLNLRNTGQDGTVFSVEFPAHRKN